MDTTKKLTLTEKPNSIVFKIENVVHVFLLDLEKNEIFDLPSIPITDSENVYEWMKPSQISFARTMFSTLDDKPVEVKTYQDLENLKYKIRDLFSITIADKDENETPVETVLKEGELNRLINGILVREVNV